MSFGVRGSCEGVFVSAEVNGGNILLPPESLNSSLSSPCNNGAEKEYNVPTGGGTAEVC